MMAKTPRNRLEVMTLNNVMELEDDRLEKLYAWVDEIPLSRPKKSLGRDFSDGVLAAEVVKYFAPKFVELHNYTPASGSRQKENNWYVINRKVFPKLHLELHPDTIRAIAQCKPWVVENFLLLLRDKIDQYLAIKHGIDPMDDMAWGSTASLDTDQPEVDQTVHKALIPLEDYYVPSTGTPSYRTPQPMDTDNSSTRKNQRATNAKRNLLPKKSPRVPADSVPRHLLVQKEQELGQRQETIEILQGKIQRLEHLLHLKDIRIEDLSGRVDDLESQYTRPTAKQATSYQGAQQRSTKPPAAGRAAGGSYRR